MVIFRPRLLMHVTGARGGKGSKGKRAKQIATDINERIAAFWRGDWEALWRQAHRIEARPPLRSGGAGLAQKVRKIREAVEEGEVARAAMMLQQKSMCDQKSFYDILGVPPDATLPEMKIAHRRLLLKFHPDKRDSSSRKGADRDEECPRRTRMVEDGSGEW